MSTPIRRPKQRRDALGSVERLPSGRYRARYSRDGAIFKAPHTFATKHDAMTWLVGERADWARGGWIDPRLGQETLTDFANAWLTSRVEIAPRTRALYRDLLDDYVLPRIGGPRGVELGRLALAEINPAVVRKWRAMVLTEARERIARRHAEATSRDPHPARAWGRSVGFDVHPTGRIAPAVLDAWTAAGKPQPAPAAETIETATGERGTTTAAKAYGLLRNMLNAAIHDGLLTSNPCQIRGAGSVRAAERPVATPAEVTAIAENMPPNLAAAVLLAAWSGLRFGELFALARRHVDLDAGAVRVERALIVVPGEPVRFGQPKTHSSHRTVYLPQFVLNTLTAHLAEHVKPGPDSLLFTNAQGQPLTSARLSRVYRRAREAAGRIDLRFHDLRHTGATLAYSAGASVREVQNRLGHSTMRAASIYAHAADDSDRKLAGNLDALYGPLRAVPELPESDTSPRTAA